MKNRIKYIIPKVNHRSFVAKDQVEQTIGEMPGLLVYTGHKRSEVIETEVFSFTEKELEEIRTTHYEESIEKYNENRVNWVNIIGLHDTQLIDKVGKKFNLHPLLLEDVLNVEQRPKSEDFDNHLFFTIKMFHQQTEKGIEYEHVSFVLGKNYILSFQEKPKDIFNLLRERLRSSFGKIRSKHADYLFYRFIDTIVDNYYPVLDSFADKIEQLEEEVMQNPQTSTLHKLQNLRKELILLRKSVNPLRESISALIKSESNLIRKDTERYLMDIYDHTIQVIESLDTYRDLLGGVMDLYMNSVSNRMNEIMKVLTIMSSIFIPLTFIAGIYGMNFEYIPELGYKWGYGAVWVLMIAIALLLLWLFRRKRWL